MARGGSRLRTSAHRLRSRPRFGLARVGPRRERSRHQRVCPQGGLLSPACVRLRLSKTSPPRAALRGPRVGVRVDRHTDSRVPQVHEQADQDPAPVQPPDREQHGDQLGVPLRVLRPEESLEGAVPRAHERRRGPGAALRRRAPQHEAQQIQTDRTAALQTRAQETQQGARGGVRQVRRLNHRRLAQTAARRHRRHEGRRNQPSVPAVPRVHWIREVGGRARAAPYHGPHIQGARDPSSAARRAQSGGQPSSIVNPSMCCDINSTVPCVTTGWEPVVFLLRAISSSQVKLRMRFFGCSV